MLTEAVPAPASTDASTTPPDPAPDLPAVPVIDISSWMSGDLSVARLASVVEAVPRRLHYLGFLQVPDTACRGRSSPRCSPPCGRASSPSPWTPRSRPDLAAARSTVATSGAGAAVARPTASGSTRRPICSRRSTSAPTTVDDDRSGDRRRTPSVLAPNIWPDDPPDSRGRRVVALLRGGRAWPAPAHLDLRRRPSTSRRTSSRTRRDHSIDTLRTIRYERQPGSPDPLHGQPRMGAHTDYGIVTVLYADPVPGLEIVGPDGAWHGVVPRPGRSWSNLGDLLAAVDERPLALDDPPGGARRRPGDRPARPAALGGVLPRRRLRHGRGVPSPCCSEDEPAKYPPITGGDHLLQKLGAPWVWITPDTVDTVKERMATVTDADRPSRRDPVRAMSSRPWQRLHP